MFPIQDINHRIIGFGGRLTNDAKKEKGCPKYLNSPETRVFDKSSNLYGLNFAKDTKEKEFILCEGYMDVIAMHQIGYANAVASLGTALTRKQVDLLSRYKKDHCRIRHGWAWHCSCKAGDGAIKRKEDGNPISGYDSLQRFR